MNKNFHNFVDWDNLSEMEVNSADKTSIFFPLIENFRLQTRKGLQKRCQFFLHWKKSELQSENQFENMYILVSFWKTIVFLGNLVGWIFSILWKISWDSVSQYIFVFQSLCIIMSKLLSSVFMGPEQAILPWFLDNTELKATQHVNNGVSWLETKEKETRYK